MENIRHIIEQERELIAKDTFSRRAFDCSEDMSEDRKDRYISYLVDRVNETELDKLVQVLKDFALEKDSIVNCDETWCKVRKYDKYRKCYIWVLVNKAEQTVIFFYEDGSRGRDVLVNFLGDAELRVSCLAAITLMYL